MYLKSMKYRSEYRWDEEKAAQNERKHGVAFGLIDKLNWEKAVTRVDKRTAYGEERYATIAPIDGRLYVLVWTSRADVVRVISLRKANSRERMHYNDQEIIR